MTLTATRARAAVLISGRGSNLSALIAAAAAPDYPAGIALVLSNRADAPGLDRAREAGIPTEVVDSRRFGRDRAALEAEVAAALSAHGIGLLVLAGFMRILTQPFVREWEGRVINVHPSLLPAFPGLHTHARALAAGVRIHGCTVHFVTPGVDEGPAIAQAAVPVLPSDDERTLAARVLEQEHRLLPAALAWLARGEAALRDGRVHLSPAVAMAGDALLNPVPSPVPQALARPHART